MRLGRNLSGQRGTSLSIFAGASLKPAVRIQVVLGISILAFGCADANRQAGPMAPEPGASFSLAAEQDPEKAALTELTRIVALALNDQGLRQRVKSDMRESRHTREHKLHFSNYLHGQSGGILLAKMAKESGKNRGDILALLGKVRPLEFYMPVREQRESWRGGDDLWVASLVEDHDIPTAYTLRGEQVALGANEVPAMPTLAIVPVEADFSRTLDVNKFKNKNDGGGETIGTYSIDDGSSCDPETAIVECDTETGGGGEPTGRTCRRDCILPRFISLTTMRVH